MAPAPQPHDALFKAAFETPSHARALLIELLPPSIVAAIDWTSLTRESGSFIDPELRSRHGDLLFSVQLAGRPETIYVLLEHQSEVDRKLALRVADYLVRVWKRYEKDRGLPLPLLIPVTIAHPRTGWTEPTSLHDLIQPAPASLPDLAPQILALDLHIFDLAHLDDARLRNWNLPAFPKLALVLLRDARNPDHLHRAFEHWRDLFLEVLHARGSDAVMQVLRYIAEVAGEVRFEELRATIARQIPELEDTAVTIAEQLRQQGRQQGLQQGLQQGRAEQLTKLIRLKFGPIPPQHDARVQTASIEELDRYSERILSAETIDELLAV